MAEYYNVTTNLGDAEIADAITNNAKIQITHIAFGDGAGSVPTPSKTRTTLVREVHRQAVTKYERHPTNPNWIVIETIIPSDVGGFTIREMGIIGNGKLLSHGSHAPFEKVADPSGVSEYRLKFTQNITDGNVVSITLDDSLIYATQAWVEENFIKRNEIVDDLTTDDATKPVSARQAKLLDETKLSKSSNLSDIQDVVLARTNLGLGTAATANLTANPNDEVVGRVMKSGDYGLGPGFKSLPLNITGYKPLDIWQGSRVWFTTTDKVGVAASAIWQGSTLISLRTYPDPSVGTSHTSLIALMGNQLFIKGGKPGSGLNEFTTWAEFKSTANTTVDGNGFIKAASPVVELYANKIKLNDQAQQQDITFEKLSIGDYLIKGSTGLAQEGWYVEQPKDANGNVYHAVVYEQLDNGDISIKTFEQKLEGTKIVADLDRPVDIKEGRFISIRLNKLPQDVTAPQNPNVVDNEGNPAPSKYHVLENGIWVISDEDTEILAAEKYQAYLQSLKPLTRRQFKLALLENGLLDQIENSISAIGDDKTRSLIQIEYAEATEFHRTSDSVAYMCQLLVLTDEQVDQMWEHALTL